MNESRMTIERQILDKASALESFTVGQLQNSLAGSLCLERTRLNWYLAKLVREGKLSRVARGIYTHTDNKHQFLPQVGDKTVALYRQLHASFPEIGICVYEGDWLFQFMHHIVSNKILYIEVEKDVAETVFHQLQDAGEVVYLRPDLEMIYHYIDLRQEAIFVKNLTSESPLQLRSDIPVPSLEKLLVDMYCDPDFYYLQGIEYHHVMHHARSHYVINLSRMLRYARRRSAAEEIQRIFDNSLYDID